MREIPKQLLNAGFVKLKGKKPFTNDWQLKPLNYEEISEWHNHKNNYGVLAGVGGIVEVDADHPTLVDAMGKYSNTFTVGTSTKDIDGISFRKRHYYFYDNSSKDTNKIVLEDSGTHIGQINFANSQTVGPGSKHPDTGHFYEILNDAPIQQVDHKELIKHLEKFAVNKKKDPKQVNAAKNNDFGLNVIQVLQKHNIDFQVQGGSYSCAHPVHGSENGMNLNIDPIKNIWHCFRHNTGGGVVSLIAVLEGIIDCKDAVPGGLKGEDFLKIKEIATSKYRQKEEIKEPKQKQVDVLVALIDKKINEGNIKLILTDRDEEFVSVRLEDHREVMPIKSRSFNRYLRQLFLNDQGKIVSSDTLDTVCDHVGGLATMKGENKTLFNRVAREGDNLWFDLTNSKHEAVKINSSGWEVVNPPALFIRHAHQIKQVYPTRDGNVHKFLDFVNIKDDKERLLLLVYLVSCFIYGISHPVLNISGVKGAAKSTMLKLIRMVVDPSLLKTVAIPTLKEELLQILANSWFSPFDNISRISEQVSNIFCSTTTGYAASKRKLYSNNEDVIYTIWSCVALNGINNVATRSDLLDRCISIELEPIPPLERVRDKKLYSEFNKALPEILGGVLDILVRAINIEPTIELKELPRMADFAIWGCAIAEALGYSKEEFLNAYTLNLQVQNDEILSNSLVAQTVISLMDNVDHWNGTASRLLKDLEAEAEKLSIKVIERGFPKAANSLSMELNRLKPDLEAIGIKTWREKGSKRITHIHKNRKDTVFIADTVSVVHVEQKSINFEDDPKDDIQNKQTQKPSMENIKNNEETSNIDDTDDKDDKDSAFVEDDVDSLFEPVKDE